MLKDITLGQFFPGESPLHRMDPRAKLLCAVLFIVLVFLARSLIAYAALLLFLALLIALSSLSLKVLLKGVKPVIFIALFTAVINIFWTAGEAPLLSFWVIVIYPEGLWAAFFMVLRIVSLILGSSLLLTYTTSPMALTDALERLLKPLSVLHVPVHEFAMMMTIALRFVPTLIEETGTIINAQKARGADFESGNLFRRAKALVPVLIPLFVSAFRRADELAVAMECRCYHGGKGRTRLKVLHFQWSDALYLISFCCFGASLPFLNNLAALCGMYVR